MDLKKEDEEYIDSQINKSAKELNKDSKSQDNYKKLDQTILQWCPFVLILVIIIGILLSSMSAIGNNNFIFTIIFSVGIFLIVFSASYMFSSLVLWIGELIIKPKTDNSKSRFYIKTATGIALATMIVILISAPMCCGPTNTNPASATKQLLKTQVDSPGAEMCTTPVTFQRNSSLAASGITQDTGLNPEQVYFDNPQQISSFDISNPQTLKYTSTTSKKVKMCILCSNSIENLNYAISENARATDEFGSVPNIEDNQTICVIYPRKTA